MSNGSNTSRRGGRSRSASRSGGVSLTSGQMQQVASQVATILNNSNLVNSVGGNATAQSVLRGANNMVQNGRAPNVIAAMQSVVNTAGSNVDVNQLAQQILQQQQNAQPTAATQSQDAFMKMSGSALTSYLGNLSKTVKMPPLEELPEFDTQRLVYDLGLNAKPTVVSQAEFNKLSGETYYRGVSKNVDRSDGATISTALEVANQTMYGATTRIGAGVHGDGFYFSNSKATANAYAASNGKTINDSAIMRMKIDPSKAKVVESSTLRSAFNREPASVQRAFRKMTGVDSNWGTSYESAYALWKGYNVIKVTGRGFMIPLSREPMVISDKLVHTL